MKSKTRQSFSLGFFMLAVEVPLSVQIVVQQSQLQAVFNPGGPIRFYAETSSTRTTANVGKKGGPNTYDFSSFACRRAIEMSVYNGQ